MGVKAGSIKISRRLFRCHGLVFSRMKPHWNVIVFPSRSTVMGMVSPSLRTTRHLTLAPMPVHLLTGLLSTATIRSPGRSMFKAGESLSTSPMMVVFSDSRTGRPTPQTTKAKTAANTKLKSGPANATMILSQAEMGGSSSRGLSVRPSMTSMGAICGSDT